MQQSQDNDHSTACRGRVLNRWKFPPRKSQIQVNINPLKDPFMFWYEQESKCLQASASSKPDSKPSVEQCCRQVATAVVQNKARIRNVDQMNKQSVREFQGDTQMREAIAMSSYITLDPHDQSKVLTTELQYSDSDSVSNDSDLAVKIAILETRELHLSQRNEELRQDIRRLQRSLGTARDLMANSGDVMTKSFNSINGLT